MSPETSFDPAILMRVIRDFGTLDFKKNWEPLASLSPISLKSNSIDFIDVLVFNVLSNTVTPSYLISLKPNSIEFIDVLVLLCVR